MENDIIMKQICSTVLPTSDSQQINRVKCVSLQKITTMEAQMGVENMWQCLEQNSGTRQWVVVLKMAVSKVRENKISNKFEKYFTAMEGR